MPGFLKDLFEKLGARLWMLLASVLGLTTYIPLIVRPFRGGLNLTSVRPSIALTHLCQRIGLTSLANQISKATVWVDTRFVRRDDVTVTNWVLVLVFIAALLIIASIPREIWCDVAASTAVIAVACLGELEQPVYLVTLLGLAALLLTNAVRPLAARFTLSHGGRRYSYGRSAVDIAVDRVNLAVLSFWQAVVFAPLELAIALFGLRPAFA